MLVKEMARAELKGGGLNKRMNSWLRFFSTHVDHDVVPGGVVNQGRQGGAVRFQEPAFGGWSFSRGLKKKEKRCENQSTNQARIPYLSEDKTKGGRRTSSSRRCAQRRRGAVPRQSSIPSR